jgi:hypothetical protein
VGVDLDAERLIADHLGAALLAALGVVAWLLIVARRAERARGLVELCRTAARIRGEQEKLRAAGRPAPLLERAREVESAVRVMLRRDGLVAAPARTGPGPVEPR